ncbi:N-methyl-L-tryptophan oxidase [Larsenimonas suaedae]|uniref:N-methyl-L-tryptophan oxidase n=1 Tax=Larsenimonas suaedae TaxID=1851019 RepID=A0ABU1GUI9_9GAMM|nr:N-methyl-L-tryptophan oxidase [Larsenimonas suaedae]MCM2971928.1 N-methyl-L-tryptophan oxidase [Larsenimonas suaedae]MDR5895480.1 N-methyl-L-tryptophan oxidase [Larsenimonas suaedae]
MAIQSTHTPYLIIGGGSMGLATADALAATELSDTASHTNDATRVRVLDAHSPPHAHGAHHGQTRLIRLAYGEGAGYVTLARRALALWRELERETGESLFLPTGVINVGPDSAPFVRQVQHSAATHGLSLDTLDAAAVTERFPGWALSEPMRGCFEAEAGVLWIERILAAWRRRVERSRHAELVTGARVVRLSARDEGGFVAHCADGRTFSAERVLLAAGAHTAPLADTLDVTLPLTRIRKTFAWFEADDRYLPERFSGFSLTDPEQGVFYGFPDLEGAGFKIGRHDGGQPVAPDDPLMPFGAHGDDEAELRRVIERYLPGVGEVRHGVVCHYVRSPDEHFVIDEPRPGLMVAGGFSGHGFKFASALGEALAHWLLTAQPAASLSAFRLSRFTL